MKDLVEMKQRGYIFWITTLTRGYKPNKMQKLMTMFLFSGFSFFHLVFFLYPHRHGNPSSFRCIPHKLPRYCPSAWCWFCVDIRLSSIVVESIVPEFGSIQEIRDGLGKSWILPCVTFVEHFWMNTKVFQAQWCILSIFMIKRNTCF